MVLQEQKDDDTSNEVAFQVYIKLFLGNDRLYKEKT